MSTLTETAAARFHTSLNISDLDRSVAFYRVLFGTEPAKQRRDYAKFELENPPLVLSLIPGRPAAGGNLNHLGLRVSDSGALVQIQHRLEAAGIATRREEGVECCYAKQTKFWVTDPDRTLWEIYILHEDTDEHGEDAAPEPARVESFARTVPRERTVWQHNIAEAVPGRIPRDNNSIHEISFEGTVNLKTSAAGLAALLADAFRVLRPGGEIRLHGLAGDAPLSDVALTLPGPAAAVEFVPTFPDCVKALRSAGFVEVRFEKLSEKAYFEVEGVGLREMLLVARKPGHRPRTTNHAALYLGPMAQVTDDFGNTFARGERVPLNIHDWQALKNSPVAGEFLLLEPQEAGRP